MESSHSLNEDQPFDFAPPNLRHTPICAELVSLRCIYFLKRWCSRSRFTVSCEQLSLLDADGDQKKCSIAGEAKFMIQKWLLDPDLQASSHIPHDHFLQCLQEVMIAHVCYMLLVKCIYHH